MNHLKVQLRYVLPIWLVQLLCSWLPDNRITIKIRGFLVGIFLPGFPVSLSLAKDVTILAPQNLHLGKNIYFAKGCWINAAGSVSIEDEVMFGPYVVVTSSRHTKKLGSYRFGRVKVKKIFIAKGVWVGAHAVILPGASIGLGSLISAMSVVRGSVKDDELVGGLIARSLGVAK